MTGFCPHDRIPSRCIDCLQARIAELEAIIDTKLLDVDKLYPVVAQNAGELCERIVALEAENETLRRTAELTTDG